MQRAIECRLANDLYLLASAEPQCIQALYQGLFCLYAIYDCGLAGFKCIELHGCGEKLQMRTILDFIAESADKENLNGK